MFTRMNRYKAFFLHFFGSACVLLLVFLFVRLVWFPEQLFGAASGTDLITIVILVDLTLGPLITLIIFNPRKASLKFDLACVLICQVAFLSYGVWSIYSARPVYIVFVEKRFHLVTANEIDPEDQEKASNPRFKKLPLFGPELVAANEPKDEKESQDLLFGGLFGMGAQNLPQYFISYDDANQTVKSVGKMAKDLKGVQQEKLNRLMVYEEEQNKKGKRILFLPMVTRKKLLYVAVDAATGAVIEML